MRLTQNEWDSISSAMQEQRLTFTQYALNSMLNGKTPKKKSRALQNKELIIELAKWGNNLNQVAKHLNTTKGGLDRVGLEMLGRIEAHLQEIRTKYDC